MSRSLKVLCIGLVIVASVGTASADDQSVVEYRQQIMKTLSEQTAALGKILSGAIPDTNAVAHMETLALTASTALKAFEPKVPGGEARPEVWTNWDDFSKRMKKFADTSAQMSKAAQEDGKDAGLAYVIEALSCKGCHDTYSKVQGQ